MVYKCTCDVVAVGFKGDTVWTGFWIISHISKEHIEILCNVCHCFAGGSAWMLNCVCETERGRRKRERERERERGREGKNN